MTDPSTASVPVLIHPSQFPGAIAAQLRASLQARAMNHKFHYDTPRQALRWLRLHEAYSPARTDPDCGRLYDLAFTDVSSQLIGARDLQVVSLGCGGGQKDAQLLGALRRNHPAPRLRYVPADVSPSLTLIARAAALAAGVATGDCTPLALDLETTPEWEAALQPVLAPRVPRVICFFGMLPNFTPNSVLSKLAALLRPDDLLVVSANLAPGNDYAAGVTRILPLYDNRLTREWLWTVLHDLGAVDADGRMEFRIVPCPAGSGLLRIEAVINFGRPCRLQFEGDDFEYAPGTDFRLFFSYRHTPERLRNLFATHGVTVTNHWENLAGEEGVFLASVPPIG